jgi:hypothetical protein
MNLSPNCTSLGSFAKAESLPKVGVPTVRLAGGANWALLNKLKNFGSKLEAQVVAAGQALAWIASG